MPEEEDVIPLIILGVREACKSYGMHLEEVY